MSDTQQHNILSRIGSWFKKGQRADGSSSSASGGDLPLNDNGNNSLVETRSTFLRPWARRDQAITNLQEGFHTLTDLMSAVRDNLARQNERQDELMKYLSHLPQALQSTAETNKVQTETLKAIYQQMETSSEQQQQLSEYLDKLTETSSGQREALDTMRERIESVAEQDRRMSDTLQGVGSALENVSRTSHTSAEVLSQMRDNVNARDGQLERILLRQNTRFTTMLAIAIFLSVAALVAVGVVGYLLINRPH